MSRKAGAMLIGGGIAMLAMVTAGGMLTNYAWREAQEEEVQAALRAGVAAASHFMRGGPTTNEDAIKERVAGVLRGLLDELTIDKDDIVARPRPRRPTGRPSGSRATPGTRSRTCGLAEEPSTTNPCEIRW